MNNLVKINESSSKNIKLSTSRFKDDIFIQFSPQEILNCLEALTVYKDYMLPKQYKFLIDNQIEHINNQLSVQGINLYVSKETYSFKLGEMCYINDFNFADNKIKQQQCIVIGTSDTEDFIKVAIIDNDEFKIIEVPIIILSKIK